METEESARNLQVGFLVLLGDVMKHVGVQLLEYWPRLLQMVVSCGVSAQASLDDHKEGGQLKIWLAVAVAIGLAGFSYYLSGYSTHAGTPQTSVSRTSVPESYAICGGTPETIYTVDESHPNVDCLLIHKDEIRVAGTLGS